VKVMGIVIVIISDSRDVVVTLVITMILSLGSSFLFDVTTTVFITGGTVIHTIILDCLVIVMGGRNVVTNTGMV